MAPEAPNRSKSLGIVHMKEVLNMAKKILSFLFGIIKMIGQTICCNIIFLLIIYLVLYSQGNRFAVVVSGSMEPAIQTGSLCIYNTSASYGDVKEGDVIVFTRQYGIQICHRALSISPAGIETKGDANKNSDGISTTENNFNGILWMTIPFVGRAVAFAQNSEICLFFLVGMVGCIIILTVVSPRLCREIDSQEDERQFRTWDSKRKIRKRIKKIKKERKKKTAAD